jgi:hypothetical protein
MSAPVAQRESEAMTPAEILREPTDDVLERIVDAHWNRGGEGVTFTDIYQHNALNHTLSGTIDVEGAVYGFIVESGDRNGTVVKAWGDPEEVGTYEHPPVPEPRTFIPKDLFLHVTRPWMFKVYLHWRRQPWFRDKERAYNYDRHFQPGCYVEDHYREWADKKGMQVGCLSELPPEAQATISLAEQGGAAP